MTMHSLMESGTEALDPVQEPPTAAYREECVATMAGDWFGRLGETVSVGDVILEVTLPRDARQRTTEDEFWFGVGRAGCYRVATRLGDDAISVSALVVGFPAADFHREGDVVFEWDIEAGPLADVYSRCRTPTNEYSPPWRIVDPADHAACGAEFRRQFALALEAIADFDRHQTRRDPEQAAGRSGAGSDFLQPDSGSALDAEF